jgi:23S rRNA (pseudouridine1915-N3)-methyltransferase
MKWQVVCIGKPSLSWAKAAMADYAARLKRVTAVEMTILKEGVPANVNSQRMIEASAGSRRIVLDERGKAITSMAFARWIENRQNDGTKKVSVLIGGANGHTEEVRNSADEVWNLSSMTLQHELALVVFMEQLYRAYSIVRGEPYHRE